MTPEYPVSTGRTGPGGIFQWDARRSGMVSDWVAMFFRSESLCISSLCRKKHVETRYRIQWIYISYMILDSVAIPISVVYLYSIT
jgi:hypothetical protein